MPHTYKIVNNFCNPSIAYKLKATIFAPPFFGKSSLSESSKMRFSLTFLMQF